MAPPTAPRAPGVPAGRTAPRPGRASAATAPGTADGAGHPRPRLVLTVLAAVAFMAQLDLFIVNVALPAMGRDFPGAGLGGLSWVLNAYSIMFAALLVPAGRLADHFGRRRFLLAGVAVFTLASALCAVAPTLTVVVVGRLVQAAGAAMIVPASLGLLLAAFPPRRHGAVVGIWAGVAAVAASSGPPIGGLLVAVDWRWIFLVNLPIGIAALIGGALVLPEVRADRHARLPSPLSAVTVLAAIGLLTLATVQGQSWGWGSPREIALIVAAVVAVAAGVRSSLVDPRALVEASLFRSRVFTGASLALLLFFVGFASWLFTTVLFFQDVWGWSALRAGVAIAPGPLMAAVFAVNSSRVAAAWGRRVPAVVGPLLLAAGGVYWLCAAQAHPDYLTGFLPGLLAGGAGSGLTQAPLLAAAGVLPPDRATTGSAVLNMARQVGSALGVALSVALLATAQPRRLDEIQRTWWLLIATCVAASAVTLCTRERGTGQQRAAGERRPAPARTP
ncbi:MFS transporter [Streptacidiphilus sp. PB12-B1b]|uniref:MFS transporter n=1 Tax=Streptacidiphilus sp. PB12-B1b TaxID=2705012 RepID=UPI0015F901FC|nr:MFS transporter [Streptacidiphilus sp. PB12-B1b]QMU77152.1 MFS transporter [Streptacidiphilus sp. PB12-B1b]